MEIVRSLAPLPVAHALLVIGMKGVYVYMCLYVLLAHGKYSTQFFWTPQIYELCSGRLLCSFLFDFGVTSVTMDLAEYRLFVGGSNGKIAQVNLFLGVGFHGHNSAFLVALHETDSRYYFQVSRRSADVPIEEKEAGVNGGGSRKDMYFIGHM